MNQKYGPLLKELEQVIGKTSVELNVKSADVRTRETNMADFIADTYRKATGADVALANGGSIRADATMAPGGPTSRLINSEKNPALAPTSQAASPVLRMRQHANCASSSYEPSQQP